jgi:hypothetical protein
MLYRVLADGVLALHLAFIIFVVLGGLLVLRWPRLAWIHLPIAAYGVLIEFVGWVCPLTPLENRLRHLGGQAGYSGGFIEHYLLPLIYPSRLTYGMQVALGLAVLAVNALIYAVVLRRRFRSG